MSGLVAADLEDVHADGIGESLLRDAAPLAQRRAGAMHAVPEAMADDDEIAALAGLGHARGGVVRLHFLRQIVLGDRFEHGEEIAPLGGLAAFFDVWAAIEGPASVVGELDDARLRSRALRHAFGAPRLPRSLPADRRDRAPRGAGDRRAALSPEGIADALAHRRLQRHPARS